MKNLQSLLLIIATIFMVYSCNKSESKLSTPELLTPSNGFNATVEANYLFGVTLNWADIANTSEYLVEISTNPDFSTIYNASTVVASDYYIELENSSNELVTYYWRVKAFSPNIENSDYSTFFTINLNPLPSQSGFQLIAPANNSTNITFASYFRCENVADAFFYKFNFEGPYGSFSETSSTPFLTTDQIEPNQFYNWSVTASLNDGSTITSPQWSFQAAEFVHHPPTLLTPVNGANISNSVPSFSWNSVTYASSYIIEFSRNNTFTQIVDEITVYYDYYSPGSYFLDDFDLNTTYYWRVKADNSGYSSVYSFKLS